MQEKVSDESELCKFELSAGCELGQFRCGTGRCIPGDWHCDGTSDCVDDSDEHDCRELLIISPSRLRGLGEVL